MTLYHSVCCHCKIINYYCLILSFSPFECRCVGVADFTLHHLIMRPCFVFGSPRVVVAASEDDWEKTALDLEILRKLYFCKRNILVGTRQSIFIILDTSFRFIVTISLIIYNI